MGSKMITNRTFFFFANISDKHNQNPVPKLYPCHTICGNIFVVFSMNDDKH